MSETIQSLQKQLREAEENLRLIQERKAMYVQETDIPFQLLRDERRLERVVADLKARLAGAGRDRSTVAQRSRESLSRKDDLEQHIDDPAPSPAGPELSGEFKGSVAVQGGEAVDFRGAIGPVYKPEGDVYQDFGDKITIITQPTGQPVDGPIDFFVSSDGSLSEVREAMRKVLESLPQISRPWVVEFTPSNERDRDRDLRAEHIRRSRSFVMVLEDVNGFLEAEQGLAKECGIKDRLYIVKTPEGKEPDNYLLDYLGGKVIQFSTSGELDEKVRPSLVTMVKDYLPRVDLEKLLKWAVVYGLGKGVLELLREAISSAREEPVDDVAQGPATMHAEEGASASSSARSKAEGSSRQRPSSGVTGQIQGTRNEAAQTPSTIQAEEGMPAQPETSPLHRTSRKSFEPEMILIPAGRFLMGSDPAKDSDALDDEQPQHTLYLPDYYIAKTPVTNAQYQAFVRATRQEPPSHWEGRMPPDGKEDHPVVWVTWHDAMAYCQWLAEATGRHYRLPTEAEWEKAARGTDGRIYPWGNKWDASRCNSESGIGGGTTPVGKYPRGASPYGVLDMSGNVWEWCSSLWGDDWHAPTFGYPYRAGDGREDLEASGLHISRGGAYYSTLSVVRCARRYGIGPDFWLGLGGFRVARGSP